MKDFVQMAKDYATQQHQGQTRKLSGFPYIVHPEAVAMQLMQFGINDDKLLAVAWLHDTVEDTSARIEDITELFGCEVSDGVRYLTRIGKDYEGYIKQLEGAPDAIKLIKICDILDNISTLEVLEPESIERKISECHRYFIPWAERIMPMAADMIRCRLAGYTARSCHYMMSGRSLSGSLVKRS